MATDPYPVGVKMNAMTRDATTAGSRRVDGGRSAADWRLCDVAIITDRREAWRT
jgi:hypothetical protein